MTKNKNNPQSDVVGVCYIKRKYPVWKASVKYDGLAKAQTFSVMRYGMETAKRLAEECRLKWDEDLDVVRLGKL